MGGEDAETGESVGTVAVGALEDLDFGLLQLVSFLVTFERVEHVTAEVTVGVGTGKWFGITFHPVCSPVTGHC